MLWRPLKYNPLKHRKITVGDLVILLANVHRGAGDERIGFESANETLTMFMKKLNRQIVITVKDLETALWSCNLLDEVGRFWHPTKINFEAYLKTLVPNDTFDRKYNFLREND